MLVNSTKICQRLILKRNEEAMNINRIQKLEFAQNLREYHHKAIWEEEKHFSWLISIIISLQVIIYTNDKICLQNKSLIIIFLSLIGIIFCLLALKIIRREGVFFIKALALFVKEYNSVFNPSKSDLYYIEPAPSEANKPFKILIKNSFLMTLGIRESFQMLFYFLYFHFP